jgi:hypothetical protein
MLRRMIRRATRLLQSVFIKMLEPTGLRPPLIHFEHKHLSDADRMACIQYLEARGYRLLLDRVNTAAFLP